MDTEGDERLRRFERVAGMYILPCVKQAANGKLLCNVGSSDQALL